MKWSEDQIQELRQMAADGVSNTNMALHFGVMLSEIHAKRSQLGITRAKLQAKKADSAPLNTRPQKSPTQKAQGIDSIDIEELTRRVITELKRILLAESENASLSTPTESSLLDLFCKVHEESEKHRRTVLDRTFGEMKEAVKNQLALLSNASGSSGNQ